MLMDESLWNQMVRRGLLTGHRSQPLPDISTDQVKETLKSGGRVVICWLRNHRNGAAKPDSALDTFHIATIGKVAVAKEINTTFNYVSVEFENHGNALYSFDAIVPIPEDIKGKPCIEPIPRDIFDKMAAKGWVTGSRSSPIPRLEPDVVEGMLSVGDKALVCWPLRPYSGERRHESYLSVDHLGTVGTVGEVDTVDADIRVVHLRFGDVRVGYGFDSVIPLPKLEKEECNMRLISESLFTKMIDLALVTGFRAEPVSNVTPGWVGERVGVGSKVLVCRPKSTDGDGILRDKSLLHADHLAYVGRVVELSSVEYLDHLVSAHIGEGRYLHLGLDSIVPLVDEMTVLKTGGDTLFVEDVGQTVAPKKISTPEEASAAFGEPEIYSEGLASNELIDQLMAEKYIVVNQFRPLSGVCWRNFIDKLLPGQQVFLCYPTTDKGVPHSVGEEVLPWVGNVATLGEIHENNDFGALVVAVGYDAFAWHARDVIPLPLPKSSQPKSAELPPWDFLPQEPKLPGETDGDYMARRKEKYTLRLDLGEASYDRSGEAYIADFRDWLSAPMISRRRG